MCLFRLPDGSRLVRRFRAHDPARLLFDFLDARALEPGSYRLVSAYPRKVWHATELDSGIQLADAGLGPGTQVALMVESIEP